VITLGWPGWVTAALGLGALAEFIGLLINADPRPENNAERSGEDPATRDGPVALEAYREWRRLRADSEAG
jgi:hypothetical protein